MTAATDDPLAAALARGAPVDELLDLADTAIEHAADAEDTATLEQLGRRLDAAAEARGGDGRGLRIAAARARASLPAAGPGPVGEAPVATPAPPPSDPLRYAGWGSRVVAFLIDWAILLTVFSVLVAIDDVLAGLFLIFGPFAYFTIMHATDGATIGKHVLGIEVRLADGRRVNTAAAFGRTLTQGLLAALVVGFVLDALWPLGDLRAQTLHDKAANTIVIRTRRRGDA